MGLYDVAGGGWGVKKQLSVSFSGGRTSAYMAKWLIDNKRDEYDLSFIFANTGLEHEKTLEFVNECDKRWGLNLLWVEAVVHHGERKGSTHKVVTYETASRNGGPFKSVVEKYGIANPDFPHCNRELKLNPMYSWAKSKFNKPLWAIGIRVDEIDRMNSNAEKLGLHYPLISMNPTTKAEVRHWWAEQDFDLEIPEHLGNCVTCWKKSDRKLMTIAKHEPERFDFMKRMEKEHGLSGAPIYDDSGKQVARKWFRNYKTCDDIIASSKNPFVEFVDYMPELQYSMYLDVGGGCGESCEAFADME